MKLRSFVIGVGLSGFALAAGCSNTAKDCEKTATCPPEGTGGNNGEAGSDGSGSTSDGGNSSGGSSSACAEDCTGETPLCDEDSGECVACLSDADCTAAEASVCVAGACTGCSESADCTHIDGLNVCKSDNSTCVECTSAADCSGNPCNPLTNTCSAHGMDRRACESCDTDENCETVDHYCVPMQYQGTDRPDGYCLKTLAGGCTAPFTTTLAGRDTLSGTSGQNYCGVNESNVTCEAVRALDDGVACSGGEDSECPESGLCRTLGGGSLPDRCTYRCVDADECMESGTKSTCGDAPNDFCGYVSP